MNTPTLLKNVLPFLVSIASVCFSFLPQIQAVSPSPDGCYPNFATAEGCNALNLLSSGAANTGLGWYALFSDSTGSFNTSVGGGALTLNNGDSNTAVGVAALLLNSTASENTAVGTGALVNNTVDGNTATGAFALEANTIGGTLETSHMGTDLGPNTAIGSHALENNVDGSASTALGYNALHSQVTGFTAGGDPHLAANTAVGFEALANVTGSAAGDNALNTALGYQALFDLTDGNSNVAIGWQAGFGLTTGDGNVAVGGEAGVGLTSGTENVFIGKFQGPATATENHHTYISNIRNTSLPAGGSIDLVTIDLASGLLGHNSSSRRYKEDVEPMDKASEALYQFKPVSYRLKKEVDRHQSRAFGLIAEEVAEVNPDLIVRNAQDQVEGVHYEMVNAMLLNEFLKEHKKVEEQQSKINNQQASIAELRATVAQQAKGMEVLTAQLKEQAAEILRVNAQVEMIKAAPQVVVNKP
jgi:trimeric autotransporter adhesin